MSESLNRVEPRNTGLGWSALVSQRVSHEECSCPVAKFVVALRWISLINSLGVSNSQMYRWLFTENIYPSLQHK